MRFRSRLRCLQLACSCCALLVLSLPLVAQSGVHDLLPTLDLLLLQPDRMRLVKDINPGQESSSLEMLDIIRFQDTLFFAANDGEHGLELWRSDGTTAGTRLVEDLNPGPGASWPHGLTIYADALFFLAFDALNGLELRRLDYDPATGLFSSITLVTDINPGAESGVSSGQKMAVCSNYLYFAADNGTNGEELWRSDGTAAGTVTMAFMPAFSPRRPQSLTCMGNRLYFSAEDATNGRELWRLSYSLIFSRHIQSLVRDIAPGTASSSPDPISGVDRNAFIVFNDELYFTASDALGRELWKSDGTEAGTGRVRDLTPGGNSSTFDAAAPQILDNALYFSVSTDANQDRFDLWKTGGTAATTVLALAPFYTGKYEVTPVFVFEDGLYYSVSRENAAPEMWRLYWNPSHNSFQTLQVAATYYFGRNGSYSNQVDSLSLAPYYLGFDQDHGFSVWRLVNQTTSRLAHDFFPSSTKPGLAFGFTALNNRIYFFGQDEAHGVELWQVTP